ncbi:MAG: DUF3093 domain-containing protein [Cellulomonas sp.]
MPADLRRPSSTVFAERLRPGPGVWIVIVGLAGMLTLSFVPVSLGLAISLGAAALVAGIVLGLATAPRLEVAAGELRAGSAHIPLDLLGPVRPLDREATRHELGPALDARAYLCLRSWIPGAVRIEVRDPLDPTPYWVVSTRRPQALVSALEQLPTGP